LADIFAAKLDSNHPLHLAEDDVVGDTPEAKNPNQHAIRSHSNVNSPSSFVVIHDLRLLIDFGCQILLT
jgi:hypothetical protein